MKDGLTVDDVDDVGPQATAPGTPIAEVSPPMWRPRARSRCRRSYSRTSGGCEFRLGVDGAGLSVVA